MGAFFNDNFSNKEKKPLRKFSGCMMWHLSSLTRVEPMPPALEVQSLNHQTSREVPENKILIVITVVF